MAARDVVPNRSLVARLRSLAGRPERWPRANLTIAQERPRRVNVTAMAVIALLLALPALVIDARPPSRQLSFIPPAFDHFLAVVRAHTPVQARILVLNTNTDPHRYMYYRSLYALYPRQTVIERVYPWDVRAGTVLLTWAYLLDAARQHHAGYVLLWARPASSRRRVTADPWGWSIPSPPQGHVTGGTVRVRDGWGTLVRVQP